MTRYRKYEVLFVSVPPMGYLLNLVLPHRFSMIIWDVYPDTFKITGMQENHWLYRLWTWLNRKSFAKAYRIFTISERMADLLEQYFDRDRIIIQPIWSIFQRNDRRGHGMSLPCHQRGGNDGRQSKWWQHSQHVHGITASRAAVVIMIIIRPSFLLMLPLALALVAPFDAAAQRASVVPHQRQTAEQDAAIHGRERGELRSFNELLPRAQRAAGASDYIGVEPDIAQMTYRFKFMRADGRVVWVDMDGRTARVLAVHGQARQ